MGKLSGGPTFDKRLVIFNPAVGGGREVREVKNIWKPALGGLKMFYISLKGGSKLPLIA